MVVFLYVDFFKIRIFFLKYKFNLLMKEKLIDKLNMIFFF